MSKTVFPSLFTAFTMQPLSVSTGLTPVETDNGCIGFEQSRLTLECRKLYKDNMTAEKFLDKNLLQWYGAKGGFHDVYVVEITNAYTK